MKKKLYLALKKGRKDELLKSSMTLINNNFVVALLGFLFWTLATRIFTVEQIGLATTTISALSIISALTSLGFGIGLLYYLPKVKNKNKLFWSVIWIVVIISLLLTSIFLIIIDNIYIELAFLNDSLLLIGLILILGVSTSPFNILESLLLSKRKNSFVIWKNFLWGVLRILGIILLKSFGMIAIIIAWFFSQTISFFSFIFLLKEKVWFGIDKKLIKKISGFSFANYISMIATKFQEIGFPLFVTLFLGVENTAFFYISWMIANFLFSISRAVGKSYLSESSNDKNTSFKKALYITYFITILGIIIGLLLGKFILALFGQSYVENGLKLLQILLISGLFFSFSQLMIMFYNYRQNKKPIVWINSSIVLLTLAISYLFISKGIIAIGIGWLTANIIITTVLVIINWKILYKNLKLSLSKIYKGEIF